MFPHFREGDDQSSMPLRLTAAVGLLNVTRLLLQSASSPDSSGTAEELGRYSSRVRVSCLAMPNVLTLVAKPLGSCHWTHSGSFSVTPAILAVFSFLCFFRRNVFFWLLMCYSSTAVTTEGVRVYGWMLKGTEQRPERF